MDEILDKIVLLFSINTSNPWHVITIVFSWTPPPLLAYYVVCEWSLILIRWRWSGSCSKVILVTFWSSKFANITDIVDNPWQKLIQSFCHPADNLTYFLFVTTLQILPSAPSVVGRKLLANPTLAKFANFKEQNQCKSEGMVMGLVPTFILWKVHNIYYLFIMLI